MSPFKELLQARLELALGYTPNWILSPTRLPIPPLELIQFSITFRLCQNDIINKVYCQSENLLIYFSNSVHLLVKSEIKLFKLSDTTE